jgi:hypothetical protein
VPKKKAVAEVVPPKEAADSVNHKFESAACQNALWESLCHKEFGVTSENVSMYWPMDQMGWKECYQKLSFFAVKIEFSKGPLAGDVRILRPTQDKITIGRSRRNFFCLLLDDAVSREHACIRFHNHCFWIQDLGSSNGTWIRHQCAPSHVDVRLHYGDVVEIGTSRFSVSLCTWPNTSAIYSRHISYFDGYLGKLMHVPVMQLGLVVLPCKLVLAALWVRLKCLSLCDFL